MAGLLTPLQIGSLKLENRIVFPPMATEESTEDGFPKEELYEHYAERSEGPGLVIVEHSYVNTRGRLSKNQLGIYSNEHVESLEKLANTIKTEGAVAAIQINHAGGQCDEDITGEKPIAPSDAYFENAKQLSLEQMDKIKKDFVSAAERAVKAGFEAVEIHGAHGFLLGQFLSPLTNQRDDEYGGEELEDRMRFPLKIVEEVNEAVEDISLLYRLGATDMDEDGLTVDEAKVFAEELVENGIDILDVSGNLCGSRPDEFEGEQGYFVPIAENIKDAVDVPVIGVGGIKDASYADRVIKEEKIDLVAVGRGQWKDPKWALKAKKELKND
ncbi:MAG: NADH:flavin oxidoreductase [Candidatus Thermoplasmatota archaeon]